MLEPLQKGKSPSPPKGEQALATKEMGNTQSKKLSEQPTSPSEDRGLEEYFENLLPGGKVYFSGNREITPGLQVIELDTIPYNAKYLYVTGFKYLALKPQAVELFQKCSETQLRELIEQKKKTYPADVPILEQALELKKRKEVSQ